MSLKARGPAPLSYVLYGLPALVVLARLAAFVVAEPVYESDTQLLVTKLIVTVRGCLNNLRAECTHAGPLPLFQYVPTLMLKALGWSDNSVLHFFAYASFLAFIAAVLLIYWTLSRKRAPQHIALLGVLLMMSGALVWYSHSTFAEMCAAFLTLAFVASCLLRLPGWMTAMLLVLAGSTKETALPFLLLIGLTCLLPDIIRSPARMKSRLFHLAAGAFASASLSALFNYFRFRTFYNRDYLTDILIVPSWKIQLDFFLGIWFSPSGGLAFFWPSFFWLYMALVGLLIIQGLRRERGAEAVSDWRERLIFYLPVAVVSVSLFTLTLGFSRWFAPFGWVAWGPRLLLPWIPSMLLVLLNFYSAQLSFILTTLLASTRRFLLTCAAFVLTAVPQFAVMFRPQALGNIFAPTPECPRTPVIQESVGYYYQCMHAYIWPRRWIFPELFAAAFKGAALRFTIFYVLMLVVGCIWIRRRLKTTADGPTKAASTWLDTLREQIEPLWVAGLALLCLYIGSLFNLTGETFDWTEYLLLGTIFPALLILLSLAETKRPQRAAMLSTVRFGLSIFLLALPVIALRYRNFKYVLIVSLVQFFITSQYLKRATATVTTAALRARLLRALPLLFVILMAWVAASRYIWWVSYEELILGSNLAFIIFVLSLLLVVWNLFEHTGPMTEKETGDTRQLIGNVLAVLLIAMTSIRTDHIFGLGEIHHWSFFTGPAEMVRQGGWLLWDVPSQYGFLVTLVLSWLPTRTVWQSLFIVNALFNFLIALSIFALFRALRQGFLNLCLALGVTLAAGFFRSGLAPYFFEGPSQLPNTGGLRFFWPFALAALLFWEYRRAATFASYRALFWAGCVLWLVATLWSAESAVYSSLTWLPPFALLVWRRTEAASVTPETSFKRRLRASARWLMLPPALLAASASLIAVFYFLRLGHGPDWRSFIEYAQAYRGGFATIPIDVNGAVWVLVIVFCAFSTVCAYFLREGLSHRALPLVLGAAGGLWATGSYFVSRSHPNNVHNLGMIFCAVIGLALYLLKREGRQDEWWANLVKSSFVPILTAVLVAVFANKVAVTDYLFTPQASYVQVEKLIPLSDVGLDLLLNSAQAQPGDPMVYIGPNEVFILSAWTFEQGGRKEVFTTYKSWMPVPLYSLAPLPEERRMLYLSRFSGRMRTGGWLIEYKTDAPVFPWFSEYLRLHYTTGRSFENATWRLTWYDYKG